MRHHFNARSAQQQRRLAQQLEKVDANSFFNLLTGPDLLEQVEAHLPDHRERKFPPTLTLSMFLGQAMSADGSCQNAVNQTLVGRLLSGMAVGSSSSSGYCQARARLPTQMLMALVRNTAQLLSTRSACGWLWRGRHVKLVDGSTVAMADTAQNQAHFARPTHARGDLGFPVARLVGVISLAHGAVLDVAMGAYRGKGSGEHGLFKQLTSCFTTGDVMLADSYYCSYFLIATMLGRGVDVLFEQHGSRISDFRRGVHLGARDHQVSWSKPSRPEGMSAQEYQLYPNTITVREVKVGGKVLVTTLMDVRLTPKAALQDLFRQRWNVELDLRNIKTTLGMEVLSCKTPLMVEKELWVYVLAYNLIRLLMAEAASRAGVPPRQLSFKHTLQIWAAWSQRQFLSKAREDTAGLFTLIAQIHVGARPGRIEPRLLKRRHKQYTYMSVSRDKARSRIRKRAHSNELRA
jgi:hypothetical protein